MSNGWLKCEIFKGMFSDEVAIRVAAKRGETSSYFVSKDQVEGPINGPGKVKVRVYRQGETSWAVLPTENAASIPVRESDLVHA